MSGQVVSFIIKKYLPGKGGWKIMPEDTNIDFKINPEVLEQVLARLRYACIFLYLYICSCGTPFHFTKIDFVRQATKKTLDPFCSLQFQILF